MTGQISFLSETTDQKKWNEEKRVLLSSKSDEYSTPQEVFDKLDEEFHFDLDPCSTHENCKCERHFTKEENGLIQDWSGCRVFCNPPYSDIARWTEKCYREGCKDNTIVVLVIPARTDTKYFHNYIYKFGRKVVM